MAREHLKYVVWTDDESSVDVHRYCRDLNEATEFAKTFVHRYDGKNAERVIAHIIKLEDRKTIYTYENINKYNS